MKKELQCPFCEAGIPRRRITEKTQMICLECDHRFKQTITARTYEVQCPKCAGYDTDVE